MLVNGGFGLFGVLLASNGDLWNGGDEIELLLDFLEGLEDDAGEGPTVGALRRRADRESASVSLRREPESREQRVGRVQGKQSLPASAEERGSGRSLEKHGSVERETEVSEGRERES